MSADAYGVGRPLWRTPATDWQAILDELAFPEWQRDALCIEYPDVNFFPERGESSAPAKAVCRRCPVSAECFAFALEFDIRHGIWSGLSARERGCRTA